MLLLWIAVGVGVASQLPRLRAHYARTTPGQSWDHFLVETGLRPVPASMLDVVAVADLADVPATMLDRAALGRTEDRALLVLATLTNQRILVAVRRGGPAPAGGGVVTVDGWQLQVLNGPATAAWEATALRRTPAAP